MIKSLRSKNFQSHKDSFLEFHPGFNSIIGTTDNGKSALYRSLYWTRFNKASNYISFWNSKEDGTPVDETVVSIQTAEHVIERVRSPKLNGYRIDDDAPLAAIGRGELPPNVNAVLNMSDINFFSQHDAPFMLTESAGKVAEKLNELVHLDDIDRILSALDKKKRDNKKELENSISQRTKLQDQLLSFSWIDKAEPLLEKLKGFEEKLDSHRKDKETLSLLVCSMNSYEEKITDLEKVIDKANPLMVEMTEIKKQLEELVEEHRAISSILDSVSSIDASISILKGIDATKELDDCDTILKELNTAAEDLAEISDWIKKYNAKDMEISSLEKELQAVKDQMPDVCPTCGKPLEECEK
jgi:exonuclease SbcC